VKMLLEELVGGRFDPGRTESLFLRDAVKYLADQEIEVTFDTDLSTMVALNEGRRGKWFPIMPLFHPSHKRDAPGFWLEGRDELGEICSVQAARLLNLVPWSLADQARNLRVFYDDPKRSAAPGESVRMFGVGGDDNNRSRLLLGGRLAAAGQTRRRSYGDFSADLARVGASSMGNGLHGEFCRAGSRRERRRRAIRISID